jgi:hypothetical protein
LFQTNVSMLLLKLESKLKLILKSSCHVGLKMSHIEFWLFLKTNLPVTYFYIGVLIMLPNYSTLSPSFNDEHLGLENHSI